MISEVPPRQAPRLVELDGIRGWAALGVAIFHVFNATLGIAFPQFRSFPFLLFSGPLAVALFFVLSGEALSASFLRNGRIVTVAKLAVKRHSRLSIPIFGSVLLALVLSRFGLFHNAEASRYVGDNEWLARGVSHPITLLRAAKFSFFEVFMSDTPNFDYNPFAWTMSIEFLGSILVFALLPLLGQLRRPGWVLLVIACILADELPGGWMADFVMGILYARLRVSGYFMRMQASTPWSIAAGLTVLGCLVLSGVTLRYGWVRADCVLAALIAGAMFSGRFTTSFFSSALSRWLGRISFALYICQFAVLNTFTADLILLHEVTSSLQRRTSSPAPR